MKMRKRESRALVTGATGYVGTNLVNRLVAEGWDVDVVMRKKSKLRLSGLISSSITHHEHDGTTQGMIDVVSSAKPNIVFHLASCFLAQHKPDDVGALIESNLTFSTQLAEAMAANEVKFLVNTGTSWQHHNNSGYNPVNLYAATKQAFEDILAYYIDGHGLRVTTLVLFDTYGPNDPRRKLVALLWEAAKTQEPLLMSPGEQFIDLVYIDDVVEAFMLVAEQLPKQSVGHLRYGVSSGKPLPLIDLAAAFERATGYHLPIVWGGRSYRPREVMTPWSNYVSPPNWQPRVPFEVGILRTRPRGDKGSSICG